MTRQEIKVGIVTLILIACAAIFLGQRKNSLGRPGLVIESQILTNEHGVKVADRRIALPTGVPGYDDELMHITAKEVDVLPKDTIFGRRVYRSGDNNVSMQMSAILMGSDRTSIHKPYYCITGQGWQIEKEEVVTIPMALPEPYELRVQLLTTTHAQAYRTPDGKTIHPKGLFIYWFVSETQLTPNHKEQMWLLARDLLTTGVLQRWGYISCFSICAPGQEELRLQQMKRMIAETVPSFQIPPGKAPQQTALLDMPASIH
jgi:hypothetical protein